MIHTKIVLFCFVLSAAHFTNGFDSFGLLDIREMLRFGHEIAKGIIESWELIHPKGPEEDVLGFPLVRKMEVEIRNQIAKVSDRIDRFEERMEIRFHEVISSILTEVPLQQRLDYKLRTIGQYVDNINDLYNNFIIYVEAYRKYERYTLEDFARTSVSSRSDSLPNILKSIHRLFVSTDDHIFDRSLLVLLANKMQETSSQLCSDQQSPQQLLYNLYTTVTLSEIKGYSMIQFSYTLLRLYNPGSNFTEEMELTKQQYEQRMSETLRAVKTAMAFAPRALWRCDPRTARLDETYTQLTELFQGYIVNEVDLNSISTCRENCGYYSYTKVHGCFKNNYCSQQRKCNGKILNCEYVDSDMWICPSQRSSTRRYEYIEYENGKVFGDKRSCPREKVVKADSWWRWIFWHCSYCFCYCDDNTTHSDRYFSLREVIADVRNNKVVTGIALKKVKQIIHMQIQEGELLPRGGINRTSVRWKPIEEFSILDNNVTNGKDYHTLAWEKRGLDLDDLVPAQDHLLTGVRFRTIGSRLNLEIMVTPFNFSTGKLVQPSGKSFWLSNDNTERTELELKNPDIPTRHSLSTMPDSKENQYVNFAPSDRVADAAQNTIPFFDIQPVESKPPIPMAGAGIFHKGKSGSGGYVALKLITYDFTPHMEVNLPPQQPLIKAPNEIKVV